MISQTDTTVYPQFKGSSFNYIEFAHLSQGNERGGNVNFLAGEASRRQSACAGQYRFAMPVPLRGQKTGQTPFIGGKCIPPPVKASPSPVSLRDASSASRAKKRDRLHFFGGKNIPPPVKASPSPVCLRRPVSLRDASSASRAVRSVAGD